MYVGFLANDGTLHFDGFLKLFGTLSTYGFLV